MQCLDARYCCFVDRSSSKSSALLLSNSIFVLLSMFSPLYSVFLKHRPQRSAIKFYFLIKMSYFLPLIFKIRRTIRVTCYLSITFFITFLKRYFKFRKAFNSFLFSIGYVKSSRKMRGIRKVDGLVVLNFGSDEPSS